MCTCIYVDIWAWEPRELWFTDIMYIHCNIVMALRSNMCIHVHVCVPAIQFR